MLPAPIDEKEFFREAVLRICGSLEIGKALWNAFIYIRNFIPADQIYLNYYDPSLGTLNVAATATIEGGIRSNLQIPLNSDFRRLVEENGIPEVMAVNQPKDLPQIRPIVEVLEKVHSSLLYVRLIIEGKLIGALYLFSNGYNVYSEQHSRLIFMLKEPFAIALSNRLRYSEVLQLKDRLAEDNKFLKAELRGEVEKEIIGLDFGLKNVMMLVRQIAPLASSVLLLGETGVGKELIASAIHHLSPRKEGPFVKVNCGAIPETLLDTELFGHEKGSFTGALNQKRGRFERANRGTIFLDEIGELSSDAQVRILRVLQEKEIERVGGINPIKVDIRVIAATHRDLDAMLREGRFREDLYFRLKVFPITIPSLRERKEDIPALVQHFLKKKSREMGSKVIPSLARGAIDQLIAYHWPGNVRELENVVERALILSRGEPISVNEFRSNMDFYTGPNCQTGYETLTLDGIISRHIQQVLDMCKGKVEGKFGMADLLAVKPSTLRKKMRKLGISFGRKAKKGGLPNL